MRNFRWLFHIVLIICLAVIIVGVINQVLFPDKGASSETADIGSEKVSLDYYIWDDEKSYIEPVISAYSALHKNVQINLHVIANDLYDEDMVPLLASDIKIDLLGVRGISKLVQFYNKDFLLDLTSYIQNNDMDVTAYGSMFNDISIGGRYYGMPTRSTCWILLYNKDIFDEAGIDYPGQMTWDEYRRLAASLTRGEGRDKIYGGYWVPWCYNFAALQKSSYLIDDDLTYARESLELLNNFYNVDKSHMSYRQYTEEKIDYRKEFEKGNTAMMPQGEWIINMLMEDEKKGITDIRWDIAPMPVLNGQDSDITWGQYQFVGIASDTSYPEETFDFVRFLCGEEGARIYAQNGIIHAYCSDEIKQLYMHAVGKESASIFFEAKKVQEQLAISGYWEVTESFKQYAQEYLLGNITLEEAMSGFEEARNGILNP
jgi:multiple sugar transport system substrate-binding protein